MARDPQTLLTSRAKIVGALGIGFGFFAGVGVTGLSMMMGILGIWAWVVGLGGPDRPLLAGLKASFRRTNLAWGCFGAFVLWVMISAAWSPATQLAGESVRRICAMVVLAPVVVWAMASPSLHMTQTSHRALLAGLALSGVFLLFEVLTGAAINRFASPEKDPLAIAGDLGRAATATLALFWAGYACLARAQPKRLVLVWYVAVAGFLAFQFGTDLNAVGIVLGTFLGLLALRLPRLAIGLVSAGSAIIVLTAPFLYVALAKIGTSIMPGGVLPLSYARRAQMWEASSQLIAQKPLHGWGLGAGSIFDRTITYGGFDWPLIQLHPHAAPLHIWLETGAVGAALASLAIITAGACAISTFKRHRLAAGVLVGGLTFMAVQWGLSHAAWREWMWVTFAYVIGAALSLRKPDRRISGATKSKIKARHAQ